MTSSRHTVALHPSPSELVLLDIAAAHSGLTLPQFILNAALTVARQQPPQMYTSQQLSHLSRTRQTGGQTWAMAEVQAQGLPLYWAEGWLEAQLAAGATLSGLAAHYGYSARTLSKFAQRKGYRLPHVLRFERAGPWPVTVQQAAERVFNGNRANASRWLAAGVRQKKLMRIGRGTYDLATQS